MSKQTVYWICQIVGWLFFATINTFVFYLIYDYFDRSQILVEFFRACINILITHQLRNLLIRKGWLKLRWQKLVPLIVFAVVIMTVINICSLFIYTAIWDPDNIPSTAKEIFTGLIEPFVIYIIWCIIYFTFHYFERYNKALQYEVAINEFELNNLKNQLNPHFIFNALNSIRALVDENPKKSKLAITQLSNIMRNSLILDKKRLISFEEELQTVKDYLALELVRYEERLRVNFDVAPESVDFNIPPMMIQTLVENGIKHGISKLKDGGEISVKSEVINHSLQIQIRNSGQYNDPGTDNHSGFGLQNTIKRLDLIYGEEASFSIQNENDTTVLTQLVIPETI
ncbi:MAG: histidine kinase [Cyclobacteriaceae bacterium]